MVKRGTSSNALNPKREKILSPEVIQGEVGTVGEPTPPIRAFAVPEGRQVNVHFVLQKRTSTDTRPAGLGRRVGE